MKKITKILSLLTIICFLLAFGCFSGSGEKTSTDQPTVSLNKTSLALSVGESAYILATATGGRVEWRSDNESVANVNNSGKITGVSKGSALISATISGTNVHADCIVTVTGSDSGESNPYFETSTVYVGIDEYVSLFEFLNKSIVPTDYLWSSSSEEISSVDDRGNAKGLYVGVSAVSIKDKNGNILDAITVSVLKNPVAIKTEITDIAAVGQEVALTEGYDYALISSSSARLTGNSLICESDGKVSLSARKGAYFKIYSINFIDLGVRNGEVKDVAAIDFIWEYDNGTESVYRDSVKDRNSMSTRPYSFGAREFGFSTSNRITLSNKLLTIAKSLGYKYFIFCITAKKSNDSKVSYIKVSWNNGSGGKKLFEENECDSWKLYSIDLTDNTFDGYDLIFTTDADFLYIAKAEFGGANIRAYAGEFISRSVDTTRPDNTKTFISEEFIGKLFLTTDNDNSLLSVDGDNLVFERAGYFEEDSSVNTLELSADWLQAAKSMGYKAVTFRLKDENGWYNYQTAKRSLKAYKRFNDLTLNAYEDLFDGAISVNGNEVIFTLDFSDFYIGENIILNFKGARLVMAGINFGKTDDNAACPDYIDGYYAKDGKTDYVIVYPENCSLCLQNAAEEIAKYFKSVSGANISACSDKEIILKKNSKIISLGKTSALTSSGLTFDFSGLNSDGFIIKSLYGSTFIDGASDRAVLYGAYEFIERILGVKFLSYDYTYTPNCSVVKNADISGIYNPDFSDRCYQSRSTFDARFTSRLRMVNEFTDIPEAFGGSIAWFKDTSHLSNYVHNTLDYVQPKLYQKDHPEWFFTENGSVIDLCHAYIGIKADGTIDESLSISPVKVIIEKLKSFILGSDASIKYFMIGQMDNRYACDCWRCKQLETKYKRSGMNIRLVNAVSDAIGKWMQAEGIDREIYICTFAYQYSQDAPVNSRGEPLDSTVIPRDNVIVRLAPIKANNYYGLIDEKQNDGTRNMMLEWKNVAKKTMIWTYHTRYTYPFVYYPTMQHWTEDYELYREMGCQYIYMQSDHMEYNDWKANMEAYVASKVLWDNSLNPYTVRDEYIELYYDGMTDLVKQYINNFEKLFRLNILSGNSPNMTLQGEDDILKAKYYNVTFWKQQFALIEQMYERAENCSDEEKKAWLKKQTDRIKLGADFTVMYDYDAYGFDETFGKTKQQLVNDFFETCDGLGVIKTGEWQTLEQLKEIWGYKG